MAFQGFFDKDAKFFKQLARNQNRDWFQAHKEEFEEGWQKPMKDLLDAVRDAADSAFGHTDLDDPKLFRIYRDVRFSKDKSPYKTHIGGVIPTKRQGKITEVPMALYFHVGQPRSFCASGHYMMDPRALGKFRAAVASDKQGKELEKILATLKKKGYSADSHDTYKRVPAGYDQNHPRAEHLKRKGLTVGFPDIPAGLLASPKLVQWVVEKVKTAAPLVEWLVFATV